MWDSKETRCPKIECSPHAQKQKLNKHLHDTASRKHEEMASNTTSYTACDQCRVKKIRCGKERPNCSNCIRMNLDCNWSGHGKKPNQTVVL